MPTTDLRVGPATLSDGALREGRIDKTAASVVTDGHGRYQEAVLRGNVFLGANTAVKALSVNSTTATGLILYNPAGSGKNLVVLDATISQATLPTAQFTYCWTGGTQSTAPTGTGVASSRQGNAFIGNGSTGVGLVYDAATIATASVQRIISGGGAATEASQITPVFIRDEVAGLLILAPGQIISIQSLTTAVSVITSFTWEEINI